MYKTFISQFRFSVAVVLITVLILVVSVAAAQAPNDPEGDHPLQDHWGESATGSGTGVTLTSLNGTALDATANGGISKTIYARSTSTWSSAYAIYAQANGGYGVYAHGYRYGLFGATNAGSGSAYGVRGETFSQDGIGVFGYNKATTGTAYGVYGRSDSTIGRAVFAYSRATSGTTFGLQVVHESVYGYGVFGLDNNATNGSPYGIYIDNDSSLGRAGYFLADATVGTTYGLEVVHESTAGYGIRVDNNATTGTTYGIYVDNDSTSGYGGRFIADASTGTTYGIYTRHDSNAGYAGFFIADNSNGSTYGVRAASDGSTGYGVYGIAGNDGDYLNYGGYFRADGDDGKEVFGYAYASGETDIVGVHGHANSTNGFGVVGTQVGYSIADLTFTDHEPGGFFAGQNGVVGYTEYPSSVARAVYGRNSSTGTSGWAGYFYSAEADGVRIETDATEVGLTVVGGSKSAQVDAADGPRLLYTEELTEVWFTDYGFGQLINGVATITIDPLFASTVNLEEPYHVFLQPYGLADLGVVKLSPTEFVVQLREGDANVRFSYRIVALRLGFENRRMEPAPPAPDEPVVERDITPDPIPEAAPDDPGIDDE